MLFLIDLDKTLIDASYQTTGDVLPAIRSLQDRGHLVGLSSDSSTETLLAWYRRFGMNGPILGERGAVLCLSGTLPGKEPRGTGSANQGLFCQFRDYFLRSLLANAVLDIVLCDPSEAIREKRYRTVAPRYVAFVNAYRRFSFHVSFRRLDATGNQTLDGETKRLIGCAENIFHKFRNEESLLKYNFFIDANPEYGLLIIHDACSEKAFGMRVLMERLNLNEAVVIGDGANDFTGLANVRHWAVGNANIEYKAKCERVANATYTAGVVELLLGV